MSNIAQTLGANETLKFVVIGDFCRLMNSTSAVEIVYYRHGAEVARTGDVQEGYAERVAGGFDAFTVQDKSGAANAIKVLYRIGGEVRYDRAAGNVSVNNSGSAQKIPVAEMGFDYGASYKSNTAMAANTPDVIFAPAANVNGAILWDCAIRTASAVGGNHTCAFIAKNAAPASIVDGDVVLFSEQLSVAAPNWVASGRLVRAVKIPAGKGLYAIANNAEAAGAFSSRSALYTLL